MAFTVAQKVRGFVITSSPGWSPAAIMLTSKAAVQGLTAAAWVAGPLIFREGSLELRDPWAGPKPTGFHGRIDLVDPWALNLRCAEYDERGFTHWDTSENVRAIARPALISWPQSIERP
jgi:hypothetical protein